MNVLFLYLLAALPTVIGAALWAFDKRIVWWEWLTGSALAFLTAGLMHWAAVSGATADVETWSGQIVSGRHVARWEEYYEYAVYRTEYYTTMESDSKGHLHSVTHSRQVFDHWEPTSRWHDDEYHWQSNIGTHYYVDHPSWYGLAKLFGGYSSVPGDRTTWEHASRMIGGDPNDYVTEDRTGYVKPVTDHRSFTNKVKATPTTFSYAPVPDTIRVYDYPANGDPFRSNRLLGSAAAVDLFTFDQMNARLGPTKKVNVILVGFGGHPSSYAQYQEAAWIGGKKNDVVICYGGPNEHPTWVRAFGWTDTKTCLRDLESIVLSQGMSTDVLPAFEAEVQRTYQLKHFERDFDYVRVPAPMWAFWTCLGVMIATQVGFYLLAEYVWADNAGRGYDGYNPRRSVYGTWSG